MPALCWQLPGARALSNAPGSGLAVGPWRRQLFTQESARSSQFRRPAVRARAALDGMQTSRLCLGARLAVQHASRLYMLTDRQCSPPELSVPTGAPVAGTMLFGEGTPEAEAHWLLDVAAECGINFFDSAELYPVPQRAATQGASERILGAWLARRRR